MKLCIPIEIADKLRKAIKDGEIDFGDLFTKDSSSEGRIRTLNRYFNDEAMAKTANLVLEKKFLLKHKMKGIENWMNKVTASGRYSKEKVAELKTKVEEYKVINEKRLLKPKEDETFLKSLVDKKYNLNLDKKSANQLYNLTEESRKAFKSYDTEKEKWNNEADRIIAGTTEHLIKVFERKHTGVEDTLSKGLKDEIALLKDIGTEKGYARAVAVLGKDFIKFDNEFFKSMTASVDDSFSLKQASVVAKTHPKIWYSAFQKSFGDFLDGMGAKDRQLLYDIEKHTRPNYINGEYTKTKFFPAHEEELPASTPSKIPVVGRVFTGAETAFTQFAGRIRMDLYDMYRNMQKKLAESQEEMIKKKVRGYENIKVIDYKSDYEIQSRGTVVKSMTGRGEIGKLGQSQLLSAILWAPRLIRASWDTLTAHLGQDISPFMRKQALKNLGMNVMVTATTMFLAQQAGGNKIRVGFDPHSSDFGKVIYGNTRYSIPNEGEFAVIVLATRVADALLYPTTNLGYKSSTTGIKKHIGTSFADVNPLKDIMVPFLRGKFTPLMGFVTDFVTNERFGGKSFSLLPSLAQHAVPISIQNVSQNLADAGMFNEVFGSGKKRNIVPNIFATIFDFFGANSGTYSSNADWQKYTSSVLKQLKTKVGVSDFKKANKEYNNEISNWVVKMRTNKAYIGMSDVNKQKLVARKKLDIKKNIYEEYGFKPKRKRSDTKKFLNKNKELLNQ